MFSVVGFRVNAFWIYVTSTDKVQTAKHCPYTCHSRFCLIILPLLLEPFHWLTGGLFVLMLCLLWIVRSPDLSLTCKQLGLEDNGVRDIIAQLGSENHGGLVSLEQLRQQVSKGHEKSKVTANISTDEMSAKKMNEKSSGKESWEIDSGAHDFHGDPTLQQIMSVANSNSKGQSRSSNFLELANTVSWLLSVVIFIICSLDWTFRRFCGCEYLYRMAARKLRLPFPESDHLNHRKYKLSLGIAALNQDLFDCFLNCC